MEEELKQKAHYIAVTGIIRNKEGKYLICKRADTEKIFPGKWCVPGGKAEATDFIHDPKDVGDYWLDVFERVLHREVEEETGIRVKNIGYVSNLAFLRPNGFSSIIISLHADHHEGEINLNESELVDHAWVTLEEAKEYDLLENLFEQMERVEKRFS